MNKLENWKKVTKGIYRYVIAANACYEIHILTWNHKTDLLSANACVYVVGEWRTSDGDDIFEREMLYQGTLAACMEVALSDYDENVTVRRDDEC